MYLVHCLAVAAFMQLMPFRAKVTLKVVSHLVLSHSTLCIISASTEQNPC